MNFGECVARRFGSYQDRLTKTDREEMREHWKKLVKADYESKGEEHHHLLKIGTAGDELAVHIDDKDRIMDVVGQKWESRQCAALAGRVSLINVIRPAEKQLEFSDLSQVFLQALHSVRARHFTLETLSSMMYNQAAHSINLGCSACSSLCCFLLCNTMSALRFFASATVSSFVCRSPMPVDTKACLRSTFLSVNSFIRPCFGSSFKRCRLSLTNL